MVSHPTRQHSHQLAHGLYQAGYLQSYLSLLPDRRALSWIPSWIDGAIPRSVFRNSLEFLPENLVKILIGPLYFQKLFIGIRKL